MLSRFGVARFGITLAVLALSGVPALAQSPCGNAPVPPALATTAELNAQAPDAAKATKHDAFVDVKKWQGDLKSYRDGLTANADAAKARLLDATREGKKDKIAAAQGEVDTYNKCFDSTVDTEQRVVGEYVTLQNTYCKRGDVDKSTCPKPK